MNTSNAAETRAGWAHKELQAAIDKAIQFQSRSESDIIRHPWTPEDASVMDAAYPNPNL